MLGFRRKLLYILFNLEHNTNALLYMNFLTEVSFLSLFNYECVLPPVIRSHPQNNFVAEYNKNIVHVGYAGHDGSHGEATM